MGEVRIIGGQWRGRKIEVLDKKGLRPTPNRVRETLFNWLQGYVEGTRCLDLFAGSGALGFEALSRGATEVVFVEQDRETAQTLRNQCARLGTKQAQVMHMDALSYLKNTPSKPFDVIFLDPPFFQNWISLLCPVLANLGWLAPDARVYLETEKILSSLPLPQDWVLLRSGSAGEVNYALVFLPVIAN
ncbi:Ribosomal RNA small subunit methyltransferase D [Gammaproteobacteria bacterium]